MAESEKTPPARTDRLRRYTASLPERVVRAGTAVTGGLIHEASEVLLPGWLRDSKLYEATVERVLRIAVELVGDVPGVFEQDEMSAQELLVRKTAGNAVELASVLAVGWSPLWLLAAASDLTGGTRVYLQALVAELQRSELLSEESDISSVEELLDTLEKSSGLMADTIDVPPLNVQEMRASFQALRQHAGELPDARDLARIFAEMQAVAAREGRSLLTVSSLIAAGALRAGIQLGNAYSFEYYRQTLRSIADEGLTVYVRRVTRPYVDRVARHLDPEEPTYTDRLLDRLQSRRAGANVGTAITPEPESPASEEL